MRLKRNQRAQLLHAIVLMLLVFSVWGTAQAAFLEITGDPLKIQADEYATMAVFRWENGQYDQQYYGPYAKGSVLFLNGADTNFRYGGGSSTFTMYTGDADRFTPVSHSKTDDWTISTVYNAGATGVQIQQTVSYTNGSAYYQIKWVITNTGNLTYSDVRWIHGGDTYFADYDSSEGHWNDSQGMVYLKNETNNVSGIMGLYGGSGSRASHYYEDYYGSVETASLSGQLPDTVNPSYLDAGYALQWNRSTLGPGEIWTIIAFEKWTEAGNVQVVAPAGEEGGPGQTVTYLFSVQNYQATQDTFNLQVTSSGGWATNLPGGNTVTVAADGDQTVTVEVVVPPGAGGGATDTLTLTAISQTNAGVRNSDSTVTTVAASYVTVNFIVGNGGSISGDVSQPVIIGGSTTSVLAVPNPGYHFKKWIDAGGNTWTANPLTITNVTSNMTITANFEAYRYMVNFISGTGGSISGNSSQLVPYGSTCASVKAIPDEGYEFTGWAGDYTGTNNPLIISDVTSNTTITAIFTLKLPLTHTVTFTSAAGGSISGNISQTVNNNANCTPVTAVPDAGYDFAGWSGGYTGTANPLTITNVTADLSITANFKKKTFTVNAVAGAGGNVSGTQGNVSYGDSVTLSAVPDAGYEFTGWSGDYMGPSNPLIIGSVTSNVNVVAHFNPKNYSVTFTSGAGGKVSGNTSQTVALGASSSAVTAVPDAGYEFAGWSGGYTGMTNPLTLSSVTSNMNITANFKKTVGNLPPAKPALVSPADNAVIPPGSVALNAGSYSDPEADPHTRTWWQVRVYGNPEPFINEKSDTELTSYLASTGLEAGLQYEWRAAYQDAGSGEYSSWSEWGIFVVGQIEVDENVPPVEAGVQMKDYKLVSFIQWPENPAADAVFGPMMGERYNDKDYRIGTYDPTFGQGGYREYPGFTVEPGRAYWFLSRQGAGLTIEGVPVSTAVDFCLELKFNTGNGNGWNMIAPPNNANYRWGDLQVTAKDDTGKTVFGPVAISELAVDNPYIDKRVWTWDAGSYAPASDVNFMLQRYEGYWVRAKQANVYLCFPANVQIAKIDAGMRIAAWAKDIKNRVGEKILGLGAAYAKISMDSPPMPMGGLNEGSSAGGTGCFISTTCDKK